MIVRNKKNGTNVLAFGSTKIILRGGEIANIPELTDTNDIINVADFKNRGWFEIVENKEVEVSNQESNLEKAKKQVKEYAENSNKQIK